MVTKEEKEKAKSPSGAHTPVNRFDLQDRTGYMYMQGKLPRHTVTTACYGEEP